MHQLALLLLSGAPLVQQPTFTVTRGATDAGCQLAVDDVTLSFTSAKCAPTALDEKYPVGAIGEATFVAKSDQAYAGRLSLNAGAEVKPHQHDSSMEIVVFQSGRGTFTLDGGVRDVGPGDAVVIPKGAQHAFTAGRETVKAVQFYLPPGPEERFKPKEKKP